VCSETKKPQVTERHSKKPGVRTNPAGPWFLKRGHCLAKKKKNHPKKNIPSNFTGEKGGAKGKKLYGDEDRCTKHFGKKKTEGHLGKGKWKTIKKKTKPPSWKGTGRCGGDPQGAKNKNLGGNKKSPVPRMFVF